ncbi:Pyocin activator protein PrtN [Devosia sp. 17-2-E-8]|nr:Pyocin activator protein PrtN [Devosia sp. 17-2-E-8]
MNTFWLLMARYEGIVIVPADLVVRDFFQHLDTPKFVRKVNEGEIDIPLVRIEGSNKAAKGVPLADLARYLDAKIAEARQENDKMFGRAVRQRNDRAA